MGSETALRMSAYHYGFTATGDELVDRILSAVACAGKAFHHTENWLRHVEPYESVFRGHTPAEWIQRAAEDAAAESATLRARVQALEQSLETLREMVKTLSEALLREVPPS